MARHSAYKSPRRLLQGDYSPGCIHLPNLCAARAVALAASSWRFFGAAVDSSEARSLPEILAMSSTAERKTASFTLDGLLKPLIFLTNCSDAARISSSVTGGSKLNSVLIFLHIWPLLDCYTHLTAQNKRCHDFGRGVSWSNLRRPTDISGIVNRCPSQSGAVRSAKDPVPDGLR
jgi:hypothetical protein